MKVIGIVAEYNPFHNGHLYQIRYAKEKLHADLVIVVMSGNFVQRGQLAIIDKWSRAGIALENGVDLIVELPIHYALQSADLFSRGSLKILSLLGISHLLFGTEGGTPIGFQEMAEWLVDHQDNIKESFQNQDRSKSYAEIFHETVNQSVGDQKIDWSSPNNILGLAYAKEIYKHQYPIQIETLKRMGKGYHDEDLDRETQYSSASGIRKSLIRGLDVSAYSPMDFSKLPIIKPDSHWPYLQYQLAASSLIDLKEIYQMEPGFERRLKNKILESSTYEDFIKTLKPKHLTQSRVERIVMYSLLKISTTEMVQAIEGKAPIRVLGFSLDGQKYLNHLRKKLGEQIISNINQKNKDQLALDIRAGQVYEIFGKGQLSSQDFKRKPLNFIDIG